MDFNSDIIKMVLHLALVANHSGLADLSPAFSRVPIKAVVYIIFSLGVKILTL